MQFFARCCLVVILILSPLKSANSSPLGSCSEVFVEESVKLNGSTAKIESDFGPPDLMFCTSYPEGVHYVTTGEHLFLHGETRLTQSNVKRPNGGYVVARDCVANSAKYIPRPDATGWDAWTILMTRLLADEFRSKYPGKEQVILRISPDGSIDIKERIAFVPAVDRCDKFVTTSAVPDLDKQFDVAVHKAVNALSVAKRMSFPAGATAKEAIILATFSVDRGLNTWFPDLHLIEDIPQDQQSLWVTRICAILDEGGIYAVADKLRELLPSQYRRHYVCIPRSENSEITGPATVCNSLLTQDAQDYLLATLVDCLKRQKYREAERLAQRVSNDRGFKHVWLRQNPSPPHPSLLQNEQIAFVFRKLDADYLRWRHTRVLDELATERRCKVPPY